MAETKLNPKILRKLSEKLKITEGTVRSNISNVRRSHPSCTINAAAQIYALKNGLTVQQQLTTEDKSSLPHMNLEKATVKVTSAPKKKTAETIKTLINYDSTDHFIKGHVRELNKAYTKGCYTAAYILLRKIIENMILDILQVNYPPEVSTGNKELYWDIKQRRFKDFSVILRNLFKKRTDFTPKKLKAIERLYDLCQNFKDRANDKTHSWFHLLSGPRELDELAPQVMIELVKTIEKP